jgi:low temperature requirement protein LtrA
MARDVFSLTHFPMVCGIIAYAAAIHEAIAHPSAPLALEYRAALSVGIGLFVGGMALAMGRATGTVPKPRLTLAVVTVLAVLALADVAPVLSMATALLGVATVAVWEEVREMESGHPVRDP